jgi:hypothetical protein
VLVDDEITAPEQLNKLCGTKHDIFSKAHMPRRKLPVEIQQPEMDAVDGRATKSRHVEIL